MLVGSMAALAQTVHGTEVEANTGSITIENAAKGETYTIYKLFDATIGEGDAIAYKIPEGDIPSTLKTYFDAARHRVFHHRAEDLWRQLYRTDRRDHRRGRRRADVRGPQRL